MNQIMDMHLKVVLLAVMMIFNITGCGPDMSPATSSPSYIHYPSEKNPDVHLEFDYPGMWVFFESGAPGTEIIIISLKDQRFQALSTPGLYDLHPIPNDYGGIDIWISPSMSGQTPDTELESLKSGYRKTSWITILETYKTMIDGYEASVLEYRISPTEGGSPSVMFNRRIFFIVDNQLYKIYFRVAEKDRGGEFEQGYEYFFNSIKIIP